MLENASQFRAMGARFIDAGRNALAVKFLTQSIAIDDADAETYRLRGVAYFRILDTTAAVSDLEKAIFLDDENDLAYADLGEIMAKKENYSLAESYYERALQINDSCLDYLRYLAFVKGRLRKEEQALLVCNQIMEMQEPDRWILNLRADLFIAMKRFEDALNDYKSIIRMEPDNYKGYLGAGYTHGKLGACDLARKNLDITLSLKPDCAFAYNNLGYVAYLEHNLTEAMKLIERSLSLDVFNSYAYKNRALVWLALNNKEKAVSDLNRAEMLGFSEWYGDEVARLLAGI